MFLMGMSKYIKIYMLKFNVSILNRLKLMGFLYNVIFNKTVVTILTKCFFPYLNPTSYLIMFKKYLNRETCNFLAAKRPVYQWQGLLSFAAFHPCAQFQELP